MGEVYKNKTLEKIKKSNHYTHTANATMLFSDACVRLFLESFMSSESSFIVHAIKTCLTEEANEVAKNEDKQNFLTEYKKAGEFIHPLLEEVDGFVQKESAGNKTFASWVSLINNELVPFIALAVAGRTGNWELCNAAIKAMAPVLAATGRTNYCEELPRHLNHFVTIYSEDILKYLENGGFVVNLSFDPASSVFPDECHEMTINKDMALQVPARLSNENIEAVSNYLLYLADMRNSWSVIEAPERKKYVNTKHFTQSRLNQQRKCDPKNDVKDEM